MSRPRTPPPAPSDGSPAGDRAFCQRMLPRVSRTFAACIRLLAPRLSHEVLVAYLLCRIADTCEDSADLPLGDKEALLAHVAACMEEGGPDAAPLRRTFAAARSDDELLAREADTTLREFRRLAPESRAAIRPWVCEMCRGMAGFARLQAQVRPGRITALGSVDDLDRYCYYVAGTVGHLLSDLFAVHHQLTPRRRERLSALATSFGLGLQLTNIIKDVADDRARGWSFVPRQLCELAGIGVEQLGEAQHADAARKVMDLLIAKARRHLHDAREYCCTLPRSAWRTRVFCLTPLYFAVRTLERAAADPHLLDPGHKVKITRGEVYRIICMSHLVAPSNHLVRGYYQRLTARGRGGRERAGIAGLRG